MAKRWLPALRGALGGGIETKGLAERVRSSSVGYAISGVPYSSNWNVNRAVREGFQANPWIFRAVEVMAYTSLRRRIVLREGDPDDGPLVPMTADPSRLLFVLNRRSNPWETAAMFRYRLWAQFLLSSKGVYIEVSRSRAGRIAQTTLLDPDLVNAVPSKDNPIASFEVRTTGDTGGDLDYLPPYDPEASEQTNSVLWVRSPHPTVLTQGMSPMEAAGLSIDLDRYARLYNRDYMQSGGRPGGILGVRGSVTPETVTALQNRFNENARPGATTAIQADAMFYQDLSTAPRDMQWGEVMDRMRKEASMTFGVPESMMGDASGRTFDNADAEYGIFMEHRFAGLAGMIDDQLDVLTGAYSDDLWLRHDLSDVWVLKRHRRAEEDRMAAELERGVITYNDYREFLGLEAIDAPWARVHWIMPNKAAGYADDAGDADEAAKTPILSPGAGAAPADPGMEAQNGAALGAGLASYNAQTNANAATMRQAVAQGQGRSSGGGFGALQLAHARPAELEGKESRARPGRPATWR